MILLTTSLQVGAALGDFKWAFEPKEDVYGLSVYGSPAIGDDGTIYIAMTLVERDRISTRNKLYAVDPATGTQKWATEMGAGHAYGSAAVGLGETVYVFSGEYDFSAIKSYNGKEKWRFTTYADHVVGAPAIGPDGTAYVSADAFYSVAGDLGTRNEIFRTNAPSYSSPAIGKDGTIYFGSFDFYVHAFNQDHTPKWHYKTKYTVQSSPAIGADGTVYVGSSDTNLYALNGATGQKIWAFKTGGEVRSSPAIGIDDTIYVGSDDGSVYAINPNGTLKWSFKTGAIVYSSPAIGSDGTVYIGSTDHNFYALDGATGTNLLTLQAPTPIYSSPTIGPDGTVYFGADTRLFAFGGNSTNGLAKSPWPKFHYNLQNTGSLLPLTNIIHWITNDVVVNTLAGSGAAGAADGTGINAQFNTPNGGFVDKDGNVLVADTGNNLVRKVSPNGIVSTVAGVFKGPLGLGTNAQGLVCVAETNHDIVAIGARGVITIAGSGLGEAGYVDGAARAAQFRFPNDLAVGADGTLYISEFSNHTVRALSPDYAQVTTFAGSGGQAGYQDGERTQARFNQPGGMAIDRHGNLFVTEWVGNRVRKIDTNGLVTTVAGSTNGVVGEAGYVDGIGTAARFNNPDGIVVDAAGNLFITEHSNYSVRRITPSGVVETVAGTSIRGVAEGDGQKSRFSDLTGIGTDNQGHLYIVEGASNRVRKITVYAPPSLVTGLIDTAVGLGRTNSFSVEATGLGPFKYQWFKDDQPIPGATNTLVIAKATTNDAGVYTVTVSNDFGAAPASSATLRVITPASIPDPTQTYIVAQGTNFSLVVRPSGTPPFTYQWYKNGALIPGATRQSLGFTNVPLSAGGTYTVKVTNEGGSSTGQAELVVVGPPVIELSPHDLSILPGDTAVFNVSASAPTAPPTSVALSYQWFKDGIPIPQQTTATLLINRAQPADAGGYYVVVTNIAGAATSAPLAVLTVEVNQPNTPPVLVVPIGILTTNELELFTLKLTATDTDTPPQPLTYALVAGPDRMVVSPSGDVTWTPTEAQGPSTNLVWVKVTDSAGGSDTNNFTVVVNEVNQRPVFTDIQPQTVDELATLDVPLIASDPDLPQQVLSFNLIAPFPTGMRIDTNNNHLIWTPTEDQGPNTNLITVSVSDDGTPSLSSTQSFTVVVNEVNQPPILTPIPPLSIPELTPLDMTVEATDLDVPKQPLVFSLTGLIPAGMSIATNSGHLTWTPTEAQGPGTYMVGVTVTDSFGASDSTSIKISVTESNQPPVLIPIADVTTNELQTIDIPLQASDPDLPPQSLAFSLSGDVPPNLSIDTNTFHLIWTPTEAQGPTNITVIVTVTDNGTPPLSASQTFKIFVTESNQPPVLLPIADVMTNELQTIDIPLEATDPDLPPQALSFSLIGVVPTGMSIDAKRNHLTWTPTESQGPSTNLITVTVSDNGTPSLSATQTFTVVVNEVNQPPVLLPIADVMTNELQTIDIPLQANDPDLPPQVLSFNLIATVPAGMSIDTNSNHLIWTPTEAQGPSTNPVTVTVSDNGTPSLSATQTFAVVVNEVNSAPHWDTPIIPPIDELVQFTYALAAKDSDIPAQTLTYMLMAGPQGVAVDPLGVLTWTPTEAQGPSTNVIIVSATDNGTPSKSSSLAFSLVVKEVNSAPLWETTNIPPIDELVPFTFALSAKDGDMPAQTLTYALVAGPQGLAVDPAGVLTWTPTEAQGPSTNLLTVTVSDNGIPSLSATQTLTLVVNEVNSAPHWDTPFIPPVDELVPFTYILAAKDSDIPAQSLTYALVAGPQGMSVDPAGVLTWTPTEAQGPGTYTVTVSVADNGTPPLSPTLTFAVAVNEVNSAPLWATTNTPPIDELVPFTFALSAKDSDLPAQTLTYALVAGPEGLAVDPAGVLTWTPTEAQGPSTNLLTVTVSDNGTPSLSATQTLTLVVNDVNSAPRWDFPMIPPIDELVPFTYTLTAKDSDLPAQTLTYALVAGPQGMAVDPAGVLTWTPTEAQGPGTYTITVSAADDGTPPLSSTLTFAVVVNEVNQAPVLAAIPDQQVDTLNTLELTLQATDADVPAQPLQFGFSETPPAGMSLDPKTGRLTWTPAEAQGPGTNVITVQVTDSYGASGTNRFTLVVRPRDLAPEIVTQPANQVTTNGATALFTVSATGRPAPDYQWFKDHAPLSGGAGPTLGITNAQAGQAGDYYVVVSNVTGSVTSQVARLTVYVTPVILSDPRARTVAQDAKATFTVSASGTAPLGYQWLRNGVAIPNATGATLIVEPAQLSDAGDYAVIVSNRAGAVTSQPAALVVYGPPSLIDQPQNLAVVLGSPATFRVAAAGGGILRYQWFRDGTPIPGATSNALTIASAQPGDAGLYWVTVANDPGKVTSRVAVLAVNVPPAITRQPQSLTVTNGNPASFSVAVSGTAPLAIQWLKDGVIVPGATGEVHTVSAAQPTDAGGYWVVVSNMAGSATSQVAQLTVYVPPAIAVPPQDLTIISGDTAAFSVTATGTEPFIYQWLKNGAVIAGATNRAFSIPGAQARDAGNYAVTVANVAGSVTSRAAVLTVNVPPAITLQPQSLTVTNGNPASFSVAVSGTAPLAIQWLKDGAIVPGATGEVHTISAARPADAGGYWIVVSNMAGSATSQVAQLTVYVLPAIAIPPQDLTIISGDTAAFSVTATGTEPFTYQWLKNGAALAGATNRAFSIPGAQARDAGNYAVTVANVAGAVTSRAAVLTVNVPPAITLQPQSLTVTNGDPASFSVTVSGTSPLTLQWYKNGVIIPGAASKVFKISGATPGDAGNYTLVVTNMAGSATSQVAQLTVYVPPAITVQPLDVTITSGATAAFSVTATGTEPLAYQWLKSGAALAGATNRAFSIPNAQARDAGNYAVTVVNVAGSVTSRTAVLTVNVPPTITLQPQNLTVTNGNPASFSVTVSGTSPLTLQWYKNGVIIPGAASKVFSIRGATPGDAGSYTVVVSNLVGSVTSQVAKLTVLVPPAITVEPQPVTIVQGSNATFQVSATGTTPLRYQWLKDGTALPDAVDTSLLITNAQAADAGHYSVVVSNIAGIALSQPALLTVNVPPMITATPKSLTVPQGGTATFTVEAEGTQPLSYQWFHGQDALPNDTNATLVLSNVQTNDAGKYLVYVSNIAGRLFAFGTLTVTPTVYSNTPPVLTVPPTQTVTALKPMTVTLAATDADRPPNTLTFSLVSAPAGVRLDPTSGILTWTPTLAQAPDTNVITVRVTDNGTPPLDDTKSFTVITVYAPASLRGVATDALNKQPLAGVAVRFGGRSQTTGPDGAFVFTNLPPGGLRADFTASPTLGPAPLSVQFTNTTTDDPYTLEAEKTGYSLYSYAPVELAPGEDKEWNFSLSPSLRGLRLVLNWGRLPLDLDAHLLTPKINGLNYHIQYTSRYFGQTNRPPFAQLDTDATDGYGPETITIASNVAGIYRYYVHNYKEDQGDTGELAASAAVAQIYSTAGLIQTVTVPATGVGDYWDICAIDGANGKITVLNQIVTNAPAPDTGGTGPIGGGPATEPTFAWDFGDGQTSDLEHPAHTYTRPEAYTVSLRITLPDGRASAITQSQYIVVTGPAATPKLSVTRAATEFVITWQSDEPGYVLEYRTSLLTGDWIPVTPAPVPGPGNVYTVRIAATEAQYYFRLRK